MDEFEDADTLQLQDEGCLTQVQRFLSHAGEFTYNIFEGIWMGCLLGCETCCSACTD